MADPSWSDATRDDIHDDLGYALGLGSMARSLEYLLHPQNGKYLVETSDETAETVLSNWLITAGKKGTDTTADGWVYCTLTDETPGAGQARLRCYSDSSRSTIVAQGSANNGATITLAPESGKFLAGTVLLGAPAANLDFRFQLIIPPIKRLLHLFDGTSADDEQIRAQGEALLRSMRAGAGSMRQAAERFAAFIMTTKVRRNLAAVSEQNALIVPDIRVLNGVVSERPRGLLEDFRAAQDDNTGGSAEVKAGAATLAGAVAYPGSWDGSAVTPTYGQRGIAAVITGVCKKGLDSTGPEFDLTRKPTDTRRAPGDGTESEAIARRLRIGCLWKAPEWGIEALTINYLPTPANSSGTPVDTTPTLWSVTGLTSENSDEGKLWVVYVSSDTTLRFYRSEEGRDSLDPDELVAQATNPGDTSAFTTDDGTDLTVSGTTGATLANGDKGSVDFNVPTPEQPSSYFTITITESTEGSEWVKQLRDGGVGGQGWEPNTGGSPNIVNGQILACLPLINAGVLGDRD